MNSQEMSNPSDVNPPGDNEQPKETPDVNPPSGNQGPKEMPDVNPPDGNQQTKKTFDANSPGDNQQAKEMYPLSAITVQPKSQVSGDDKQTQRFSEVPVGNPHLKYLRRIDQVFVHQEIDPLELISGYERKNKYIIKNKLGVEMYKVTEESTCCHRACLGKLRPFDIKIVDSLDTEIIHLYREYRCTECCCPCCLQRLEVYAPPGNLVGVVVQKWSALRPNLSVQTPDENVLFRIDGPICLFSCCKDVNFSIHDEETGVTIGKITKEWGAWVKEQYIDADNFGITFPPDLEVEKKALLIGALFLIDFLYYEYNTERPKSTY